MWESASFLSCVGRLFDFFEDFLVDGDGVALAELFDPLFFELFDPVGGDESSNVGDFFGCVDYVSEVCDVVFPAVSGGVLRGAEGYVVDEGVLTLREDDSFDFDASGEFAV